jgi:spermidine/putrescine transport system permease protein
MSTPRRSSLSGLAPRLGRACLNGYGVGLFLFIYAPVLVLVLLSFNSSSFGILPFQRFTLQWYAELMGDPYIWRALGNSLIVGLLTTAISTAIGTLAAFPLVRCRFRGKEVLNGGLVLPMIIPHLIIGIALLILFARVLRISLSLGTVTAGHVVVTVPLVLLIVAARLYGFDRSLEEAARDLGGTAFQAFWHVTLPLILPGVLGGALFVFTASFDEFIVTFLTTGSDGTLPMYIWGLVRTRVSPQVNALSTLILCASFVLVVATQCLLTKRIDAKA